MPRVYTTPHGRNLSYVRKLGQGQFGVADLVRDRKGSDYCLKQVSVRTSDEDAKVSVLKEVELMKRSVHPNIVVLHDSWFERNRMYILMEYCTNSSLDHLISEYVKKRLHFTEDKVVSFLTELSSALAHLHEVLQIVHRDLKPANIFMDRIGTLKIGDFGLSKCLGNDNLCATFVGTPLYMSPEQCRGDAYSYASDVWALGCISYEFMSLRSPWEGSPTTYPALIHRIQTRTPSLDALRGRYSHTLVGCVESMLRKDPSERWAASLVNANMRPSMVTAPVLGMPAPTMVDVPAPAAEATPRPCIAPEFESAVLQVDAVGCGARDTEAILTIQHSFRTFRATREAGPASRNEGAPDVAPEKTKTALRESPTRRRRPMTPRGRLPVVGGAQPTQLVLPQCSARINELAVPRAAKKPPPLPRIPSMGFLPPKLPPRPAWT